MSLIVGFGYVTSHNVVKSVVVIDGTVMIGSVVLVTVSPLSCPGSGVGNLGLGLIQTTGCHLGFGIVGLVVPIVVVVLIVLLVTESVTVTVSVCTPSSTCRTVVRLTVCVLN